MQRIRDLDNSADRGVVAVIVAILMVPLLGFAAISIDMAATYSARQQLQTGADAAAFAIAQDCARKELRCNTAQNTAEMFALENSPDDASVDVHKGARQVRVANDSVRSHWFAPAIGIDSTDVEASATAGWGYVSKGIASLPLAFNECEFLAQTRGGRYSDTTKYQLRDSKNSNSACQDKPVSGNFTPGGFGWITPDARMCGATTAILKVVQTDTGANVPKPCDTELPKLIDQTVVLPLFNEYWGNGNNGRYLISGFFAFKVTGYSFPGNSSKGVGCSRCLEGYLVRHVDQSGQFDYSPTAPDFGASVVKLLPDT